MCYIRRGALLNHIKFPLTFCIFNMCYSMQIFWVKNMTQACSYASLSSRGYEHRLNAKTDILNTMVKY